MNRERGFTLIELLVVIAIISLLTAVLIPALRRARMHAHRVVCAANIRDMGTAVHLYAQDHEGRLPPMNEVRAAQTAGHYSRWFRSGDNTWWNLGFVWRAGMIGNPKVLYCPSPDVRFKYRHYSDPEFPSSSLIEDNPGTRISYMYNPACVSIEDRRRKFTKLDQLKGTRTLLLCDSILDGSIPHMGGWNVMVGDFSVRQVLDQRILELVRAHQGGILENDYAHFDEILSLMLR